MLVSTDFIYGAAILTTFGTLGPKNVDASSCEFSTEVPLSRDILVSNRQTW